MASQYPPKICNKCKQELPSTTEFFRIHKNGKHGLKSHCRQCERDYSANYKIQNKERLKAKWAVWYLNNKDTAKQRHQQWAQENKEHRANYRLANRDHILNKNAEYRMSHKNERREYYLANKDTILIEMAQYYNENKDRICKRVCKWAKDNPDKVRVIHNARRARKLSNGGTHTVADIRTQYNKQNGRCYYCDALLNAKYHEDHIIPLCKGGSNNPENIVISCPTCNLKKGTKMPYEFKGVNHELTVAA